MAWRLSPTVPADARQTVALSTQQHSGQQQSELACSIDRPTLAPHRLQPQYRSLSVKMARADCRQTTRSVCHLVHSSLSCSLLSTNITIKKYRTVILPIVLYGCLTWSLILREERRLRVFQNSVYRRICGLKRDEVKGNGEKYIMRSLMICTAHKILLGLSNREERDGLGM
jgi:hypothetical protein